MGGEVTVVAPEAPGEGAPAEPSTPRAESGRAFRLDPAALAPFAAAAVAFIALFAPVMQKLASDWWTQPDAGHGLLLAPVAVWLAWQRGLLVPFTERQGNVPVGLGLLVAGVLFRYLGALASELFTMRFGLVTVVVGLVVFWFGMRQALAWWLPIAMLFFSIPLPTLIVNAIALPLQFKASQLGAALLTWRDVPVRLEGNVILIPGQRLFVTEACSGLRSLTALIALGVLTGGLWLRHPVSRLLLLAVAIPVAILVNGVRVFLTGFLVLFIDPSLGEGFMHLSEGWLLFIVSFGILASAAWLIGRLEGRILPAVRHAS
ncbi:MAG: exosortase/archaeosortase family protein [Gemmatimonadales bacterium]|nr:exosortase/archaeosortase family protein [Gemmatimonadales bacterium]